MKKIKLSAIVLALTLVSCASKTSSSDSAKSSNDPSQTIVSTYSGGKVTLRDMNIELEKLIVKNNKLKGLTFNKLNASQQEVLIKEFVLKEFAYKEAKRKNLNKDQDYKEALKIFESELLKQKLFVALAKEAQEEKNLRKNYDELVEKLKDKKDIRISYIAVKTKNEADALYKTLIKSPASFAAQAKRKSLDKEVGKKGGDLGFVLEDALPKEIVQQARTVAKGQIAEPVAAADKWIVIKLEDERPAEILSFERSKDALAQNLAKKAIEDFVSKSLEKAKISVSVK